MLVMPRQVWRRDLVVVAKVAIYSVVLTADLWDYWPKVTGKSQLTGSDFWYCQTPIPNPTYPYLPLPPPTLPLPTPSPTSWSWKSKWNWQKGSLWVGFCPSLLWPPFMTFLIWFQRKHWKYVNRICEWECDGHPHISPKITILSLLLQLPVVLLCNYCCH